MSWPDAVIWCTVIACVTLLAVVLLVVSAWRKTYEDD